MSELALLGARFTTEGVEEGDRKLDHLADTAAKTERATDALSASNRRMASATGQMLASIEKAVLEMASLMRAQQGLATSTASAAASTERAGTANIRYSSSFAPVQSGATAATGAIKTFDSATDSAAASATAAAAKVRAAGASFDSFYDDAQRDFSGQYVRQMGAVTGAHGAAAKAARLTTAETLNLSRQFADIGVTAAMGMNPLMILIQQGPQIGDVFQTAAARGMGFNAVLGSMAAMLAPVMAILGPFILAAGAIGGAFAIGAQQMKAESQGIIDSLNLTEKQLKKVKDESITMGDVMKGTWNAAAKALASAFAPEIASVRKAFKDWYDELLANTVIEIKAIVGGFLGAFEAIKATWRMLPAAMGDAVASAANLTLTGIEAMINKAIGLINMVITGANAVALKVGLDIAAPTINPVAFDRVKNAYAGKMEETATAGAAGWAKGMAKGAKLVDDGLKAITRETLAVFEKRIREKAGDAGATKKDPATATQRDTGDERGAQIAQMLAQAKAEELQAQLALTKDVKLRGEIEKQIARAQAEAKSAQLDRVRASIADDKGLSAGRKAELLAQIDIVASTQARAEAMREQLIDENVRRELNRQRTAGEVNQRDLQIDVLASQRGLARSMGQRREIDLRILELQQQIEKIKLQEVTLANGATADQVRAAQERLRVLDQIHKNQRDAAYTLEDAYNDTAGALDEMRRAFEAKDWFGVVNGLIAAFDALKVAFSSAGTAASKVGAVAGVANMAGQIIGGKAGSALSGAASGAMAGFTLGGPVGAVIGGALGGLAGLFGASSAKKREREEAERRRLEEEAARALQIANQRRDMEITILELSGDKVAALAKRREIELAGMDASNRALAQQIYALQDQAEAMEKAKAIAQERATLEIRLMEATGDAAGVLAARRREELAGLNEANRAYLQYIHGIEDAQTALASANEAVETARSNLRDAYERDRDAIQGVIDKATQLRNTLKALGDSLSTGPLAGTNLTEQYERTKRDFMRVSSTASTGDAAAGEKLPAAVQAFLEASEARAVTREDYLRDVAVARNAARAAEAAAGHQITVAQQQLDALNASVAGLIDISSGVQTVAQRIAELHTALAAQQAAQTAVQAAQAQPPPAAPPAAATREPDWASYLKHYADVKAWAESGHGDPSKPIASQSMEDRAAYHWYNSGRSEGRTPYAMGGVFTNGIVSQPTTFHNSVMGEGGRPEAIMPLVRGPEGLGVRAAGNDNREIIAELRSLKAEVASLRAPMVAVAKTNDSIDNRERRREVDGIYVRGSEPDASVRTVAA